MSFPLEYETFFESEQDPSWAHRILCLRACKYVVDSPEGRHDFLVFLTTLRNELCLLQQDWSTKVVEQVDLFMARLIILEHRRFRIKSMTNGIVLSNYALHLFYPGSNKISIS